MGHAYDMKKLSYHFTLIYVIAFCICTMQQPNWESIDTFSLCFFFNRIYVWTQPFRNHHQNHWTRQRTTQTGQIFCININKTLESYVYMWVRQKLPQNRDFSWISCSNIDRINLCTRTHARNENSAHRITNAQRTKKKDKNKHGRIYFQPQCKQPVENQKTNWNPKMVKF